MHILQLDQLLFIYFCFQRKGYETLILNIIVLSTYKWKPMTQYRR